MFLPKTFPGQQPDEKIHLFLRRHWISFLPTMLTTFVMLLIPTIVFLWLKVFKISLGEFNTLAIMGISSYFLFVLAFFITAFIDYYLDISIITNQRIIDIDQRGLFNRAISEQSLSRIQDTTVKKRGILQTFFNYGDVLVQTAGETPNFEFECIPTPYEVAQKIMELYHNALSKGYPAKPDEKLPESATPTSPKPQNIKEEELKRGGEVEL